MRAGGIAPTRNVRQHDPRSNDVRYRSPRRSDSFADDFETTARLPVDIAGSCGTSRRCNRSRPCNDDNLANSYGAAKADLRLEIRLRRDEFPWHDASLRWNEATSYRLDQTRSSRLRRRATTDVITTFEKPVILSGGRQEFASFVGWRPDWHRRTRRKIAGVRLDLALALRHVGRTHFGRTGLDFGRCRTGLDFGRCRTGLEFGRCRTGLDFGPCRAGLDFGPCRAGVGQRRPD